MNGSQGGTYNAKNDAEVKAVVIGEGAATGELAKNLMTLAPLLPLVFAIVHGEIWLGPLYKQDQRLPNKLEAFGSRD